MAGTEGHTGPDLSDYLHGLTPRELPCNDMIIFKLLVTPCILANGRTERLNYSTNSEIIDNRKPPSPDPPDHLHALTLLGVPGSSLTMIRL